MMQSVIDHMCRLAIRHAYRVVQERKAQASTYRDAVTKANATQWQRIHEDRVIELADRIIAQRTKELHNSQ